MTLTEEDAGLLEQAATMLELQGIDLRNRGHDSEAAGAECSADAVRRLAVALLRTEAGATPSATEVRDQVFALCEETEERELPDLDFNRGRKFEAKQIRKALGIWHWDATHPAQMAPKGPQTHDDFVRAAVEHHDGEWPDGLTSNVLFFMGAAIQRSEFEAVGT